MRHTTLAALVIALAAPAASASTPYVGGGVPVAIGDHPSVVLIRSVDRVEDDGRACTGVAIAPRKVVTTATCAFDNLVLAFIAPFVEVVAGGVHRSGDDGRPAIAVASADFLPEAFPGAPASADLIVLTLAADSGAPPAPLGTPVDLGVGTPLAMVGWGAVNPAGALPTTLRQIPVSSLGDPACFAAWGRAMDSAGSFCIDPAPGTAVCGGDSGSALFAGPAGARVLVGLLSSHGGCPSDLPPLAARLTAGPLRSFATDGLPPVPEAIVEPSISGRAWVGGSLRCDRGRWRSATPVTFTYQWIRDRTVLDGETGPTLRLTRSHRNAFVLCVVTAENAAGASGGAAGAGPIAARPSPPDSTPPRLSRARARCAGGACVLTVAANDPSTVRSVSVGVRGADGVKLVKLRRVGGLWRGTLPRRREAREVIFIAADGAGNETTKPLRRTLIGDQLRLAIIDGTPADASAYPFIGALLLRGVAPGVGQECTGSLIAPTLFLTAAHCVAGSRPSDWDVLLGTGTLSSGGQRIAVQSLAWNPDYTPERIGSDVALLRLATAPAAPVAPVRLMSDAEAGQMAPGTPATVLGWGLTRFDFFVAIVPDDLRTATVTIGDDPTCALDAGYPFDGATMMCAATGASGQNVCFGDSGGPLLVSDGAGGVLLAGVTSWGVECGSQVTPAVFADVARLRGWLDGPPPAAPLETGTVYVAGTATPGRFVQCVPQFGGEALTFTYKWFVGSREAGTGRRYRVRGADIDQAIRCTVEVRNGGGRGDGASASVVAGPAPERRPRGPVLQRARIVCTLTLGRLPACRVRVDAEDAAGVASVGVLIAADDRPLRWLPATSPANGGPWFAPLPYARRYTVVMRGTDRLGHTGRPATVTGVVPR